MQVLSVHIGLICFFFFTSDKRFFGVLDDFADRHTAEPNINLVNKESLDNIL